MAVSEHAAWPGCACTPRLSGADGYPGFLLQHIARNWRDVQIPALDPEKCFRVDVALVYCASCGHGAQASSSLRQFLYCYLDSNDFDYEVVEAIAEIFALDPDGTTLELLLAMELERDCGLPRSQYLAGLRQLALQLAGPANSPAAVAGYDHLPEAQIA